MDTLPHLPFAESAEPVPRPVRIVTVETVPWWDSAAWVVLAFVVGAVLGAFVAALAARDRWEREVLRAAPPPAAGDRVPPVWPPLPTRE